MAKYIVYSNPEGTEVTLVMTPEGKPQVFDNLVDAEGCADEQENGYVVPLGVDTVNLVRDIIDMSERVMEMQANGVMPDEAALTALTEEATELSRIIAEVLDEPIAEECESTDTIS